MRRTRMVLGLGAALAVTLTVSACGAGVEARPGEGAAPVATTAAPGPEPDDATATTTAPLPDEVGEAEPVAVLADTVERTSGIESGRYELVVTYDTGAVAAEPVAPLRATGEFADQGRSLRVEMDLGSSAGVIEQVIVDGVAYVEVPGVGCQSVDMGEMYDSLAGSSSTAMDPSSFLDQLRAVDGDVEEVGTLDVRGVATTRLSAAYSVRESLAALPEDQAEALEELYAELPSSYLDAQQQVDVFVDADGLLRRMQLASPSVDLQGVALPASTTILDYFDFDADISIDAPTDCTEVGTSPFDATGDLTS